MGASCGGEAFEVQCARGEITMRKRYIFGATGAAIILLSGCSGSGLGMPGSPAWFATTPQAEQATYFRNRCVS